VATGRGERRREFRSAAGGVVGAVAERETERGLAEEEIMRVEFASVEELNLLFDGVIEGVGTATSFHVQRLVLVALRPHATTAGSALTGSHHPNGSNDIIVYLSPLPLGPEFLEERAEDAEGPVGLGFGVLVDSEGGFKEERGGFGVGGPEGSVVLGGWREFREWRFGSVVEGEEAFVKWEV